MKIKFLVVFLLLAFGIAAQDLQFSVPFTKNINDNKFDGRIHLLISNNDKAEQCFQINVNNIMKSVPAGADITSWKY